MIIGVDIRSLSKNPTGVGVYTLEMLSGLLAIDHQNQYKLFYNSAGKAAEIVSRFTGHDNVSVYKFGWPNKIINGSLHFLNRPKLDRLIGGCDVFWFPNLNFWSLSPKCQAVVTVHDLSFKRLPWAYSSKMRRWHRLIQPAVKLKSAARIMAVSENTKRDLMELYGLTGDKIEVVYSGVEKFKIQHSTSNIQNKYNLPERFILYLGTLEPRKNVEGIVRAFEKLDLPGYQLVIGGRRGWLYKKIYQLAKDSPVKERIRFINYIESADRFELYRRAGLLVWPSFYEGFGFPPLEAMAQGCPVITSANSSLPEVAGAAALLVDPYNINDIAQAMKFVLTGDNLRNDLISKGYGQSAKFNWPSSAEKVLSIFNSLS